MKKLFSMTAIIAVVVGLYAETPQKISYQAIVRNSTGQLVTNQSVGMRISILQGSATGTAVYAETHSTTTNANGLVTIEIGGGTVISGTFTGINWFAGPYYLKTDTDPTGGSSYTISGTSQLLSVPYALYAQKAENGNLDLPYSATTNTVGGGFSITNSNSANVSSGVAGISSAVTGQAVGILGVTASVNGTGVYGRADATAGSNFGVTGKSDSPQGTGVFGISGATTGAGSGVLGISMSTQGSYGVKGISYATTGINTGVHGSSLSPQGYGIYGYTSSSSGKNYGVYGHSKSNEGYGVYGLTEANTGKTYGVYGQTVSDQGYAVYGFASSATGITCGIYGNSVSGTGYGVIGVGWTGVRGQTASSSGYGLEGVSSSFTGGTIAVRGIVSSPDGFSGYFYGGKFYISGNTGIGIENPGAKLEVAGQIKITGGSPGAGKVLTSDDTGLASWLNAPATYPSGSSGNIQFNKSGVFGGDDKLFWDNTSKRLGLGTSSPARELSIHGGDSQATIGFTNNLTGGTWFDGLTVGIGHTNDGWTSQIWCYENWPFIIGTNNAWKMMIMPNGNVGIGKYQPTYKLDVVGDRIRLSDPGNENEWITMRTDGTSGFLDLSFSGGKLAIGGTNAGENILLNPATNGWVGVRTWNPQYELDVTGNIRATGSVYYGGTAGSANGTAYTKPDYVFKENYSRLTTEEINEYLQKENHLPWITSAAKEKEENGDVVNMTRMAFETVESVENIQLQVIEQQKLIQNQQKEINKLKDLINMLMTKLIPNGYNFDDTISGK